MYQDIKSCVMVEQQKSEYFSSLIGVRQGENLSPLLFSIFINDIEEYLLSCGCKPVCIEPNGYISKMLKIGILMYADDTVLLSDSPAGLQTALNSLSEYCNFWKLKVNAAKTKIMVFQKRKSKTNASYFYNDEEVEVVDTYKYLGIVFSHTGSFYKTRKNLYEQGRKAMFSLLKNSRRLNLPVDVQFDLFDKTVTPVLLYGCEIWGFENTDILERLHLKFCKYVLGVNSSTTNNMVYGELGRYPIKISVEVRMINFWARLVQFASKEKLSQKMYMMLPKTQNNLPKQFKWLQYIQNILNKCGLSYIWNDQWTPGIKWLTDKVNQILKDQFTQKWLAEIHDMEKCINYRMFKELFVFETYLIELPYKYSLAFSKFRMCNHKLAVERGRHRYIPRNERKCNMCDSNRLGDEYHFILECEFFRDMRIKYVPKYYWCRPNALKYKELMSTSRKSVRLNICKFVSEGMKYYR